MYWLMSLFEIHSFNTSELRLIQGIFISLKYIIMHWLGGVTGSAYCSIRNSSQGGVY